MTVDSAKVHREAVRLAKESDMDFSEAYEHLVRQTLDENRRANIPKVRLKYTALLLIFSLLVIDSAYSIASVQLYPNTIRMALLGAGLVSIYVSLELPLLTRLWTRWHTRIYIVSMAILLVLVPARSLLYAPLFGVIQGAFFLIAMSAAFAGIRSPIHAQEQRHRLHSLNGENLSDDEMARVYFFWPWFEPDKWR
ncbi:hypothetical protein DL239_14000 [Sedimentitalea sp. CY04]|uniref:Uncharacterized protein n=1 Tax=Parasedimentitalea denitrificans TaxID=2211118 RepID=A0ABX0W9J8_9RHOB|nr:hypothetical protein [Sedimentitalea sp. CY04]NIZ62091.1 hypothetical protein [Sedimentitalea sp. CY04]